MGRVNTSHEALVLHQAVTLLMEHRARKSFIAGDVAAANPDYSPSQASAARRSAQQAVLDNFHWPKSEALLGDCSVAKLESWTQLYMALAECDEAAARQTIMATMQKILELEADVLKFYAQSCEAQHKNEAIREHREHARQELAAAYARLGEQPNLIIWANEQHFKQCEACQKREAEENKHSSGWRSWLRL